MDAGEGLSVVASDPAKYGIDQPELERRFKWTRTATNQVNSFFIFNINIKNSHIWFYLGGVKKLVVGTDLNGSSSSTFSGMY